jgi:flavin reductase (DIM6/NTAB) family NADH-FMN oxidoreductase RutF
MASDDFDQLVRLSTSDPVWDRFFSVAPLVLIGSREENGEDDFAPKHMVTPLGWDNYFGFVCTPRHATYRNVQRERAFTVTYPRPTQIVLTSLAASGRCEDDTKPSLAALPKFSAQTVEGAFVAEGYLFLECELDRIVDGFGTNSLIAGRIVAAYVHPDALRASERDDQELIASLSLLAYLNPARFARIEESFSFPFPADFQR